MVMLAKMATALQTRLHHGHAFITLLASGLPTVACVGRVMNAATYADSENTSPSTNNKTKSVLQESNNECKKESVLNLEMQDYERSAKELKLTQEAASLRSLRAQLDILATELKELRSTLNLTTSDNNRLQAESHEFIKEIKNLKVSIEKRKRNYEYLFSKHQDMISEHTETIRELKPAVHFNLDEETKALKAALKGSGSDEKAIVEIITKRSNDDRISIAVKFERMYGKDLIKALESELPGNFEDVFVALIRHPVEFQAKQLRKSLSGPGTDEGAVVEVFGVHTNQENIDIREVYEELYQSNLESDLKGADTSGTVKRLFVYLGTWPRNLSLFTDEVAAYEDAQTLLRAGELFDDKDDTFYRILCLRSRAQLLVIFQEFEKLTGHNIETAIDNEFSGTAKDILIDLVKCIRSKIDYMAERLHRSVNRMRTDDRTLIRLVVSRSEIDLEEIKEAFLTKYEKTLAEFITDHTSGDYKRFLLSIVG